MSEATNTIGGRRPHSQPTTTTALPMPVLPSSPTTSSCLQDASHGSRLLDSIPPLPSSCPPLQRMKKPHKRQYNGTRAQEKFSPLPLSSLSSRAIRVCVCVTFNIGPHGAWHAQQKPACNAMRPSSVHACTSSTCRTEHFPTGYPLPAASLFPGHA